jgi:hypothetical protein
MSTSPGAQLPFVERLPDPRNHMSVTTVMRPSQGSKANRFSLGQGHRGRTTASAHCSISDVKAVQKAVSLSFVPLDTRASCGETESREQARGVGAHIGATTTSLAKRLRL